MTNAQLRDKSIAELLEMVLEHRRSIFKLNCQKALDASNVKSHEIRASRRLIARIKTIVNEKEARS